METKVSVILPVYNEENYIATCLKSLLNQTLKEIEIICINDGSTDNSLSILREFQQKDNRISVVEKENEGAAIARNIGINLAKGKYLAFLDADDFFENDMLRKSYYKAEKEKAEIVVVASDAFDEQVQKIIKRPWTLQISYLPKKRVFSYKDMSDRVFNFTNGWAWDKLFSRKFIIENELQFQNLRTTNDLLFTFLALVKAERIVTINEVLIHQRIQVPNSLSITRFKSWECFNIALLALKEQLIKMKIYEVVEKSYMNFVLNFMVETLFALQGKAFFDAYQLIKIKAKDELKICDKEETYFYNQYYYKIIIKIMCLTAEEFLWKQIGNSIEAGMQLYDIKTSRTYKLSVELKTIIDWFRI